jgi:GGDEF domain-containing protein
MSVATRDFDAAVDQFGIGIGSCRIRESRLLFCDFDFIVSLPWPSLKIGGNYRIHSELIADKLRAATAVEYDLNGLRYHGSISIGTQIYDGNNAAPDEILKDADLAMYKNKRSH